VLLIDDEPDMLEGFRRILQVAGHEVEISAEPERIVDLLRAHQPDVVITDLRMPGLDGVGVLEKSLALDPRVPVVVLTAYGTIESAVDAIKRGAFDYLTKPVGRDALLDTLRRALAHLERHRETEHDPESGDIQFSCDNLVGRSAAMRDVMRLMGKVARTDANVLITGESGTGKEVAARCLHAASHRQAQPFIPIDCASLPETLLESELFGHERGAFTGAVGLKPGVFELADGGTVLLDEIGEMSMSLQSKLLRVVQERCFRRIGGREEVRVDVRILAATNRNLEAISERGEFRQDLFFRLNVITVELPPLRDRHGDIPVLAEHFLRQFNKSSGKRLDGFSPEALRCLERHSWPGNVRELMNTIERAVVLTDGPLITQGDLPPALSGNGDDQPMATAPRPSMASAADFHAAKRQVVSEFERDFLVETLRRHGGNISRAAVDAGMNRRTLYRLIEKFEIDLDSLRD
jgi:DNA-binding NtrC family response regulator